MSQLIELWERRAVLNSQFANNQLGLAEHCLQRTAKSYLLNKEIQQVGSDLAQSKENA